MNEDPEGNAGRVSPAAPDPSLRLRSERPRVTRHSRKVLAGGAAIALVAVSAGVFWALQNNSKRGTPEELYSTDHRTTADGLAGLPATMPAYLGRRPSSGHRCPAISADQCLTPEPRQTTWFRLGLPWIRKHSAARKKSKPHG